MSTGLFDQIRATCRKVAERSVHVQIRHDRIPVYAAGLPLERILAPALDPAAHYLGHGTATLAFILTLESINFGSGYFPCMRKRPGMSGYFTVASALSDHFRRKGPLSARELRLLTANDCGRIFDQAQDNPAMDELMDLYARALNDLGRFLQDRFDGDFRGPLAAADHSAERLAILLAAMPFFRDVEIYDGVAVSFYKRAQITAADLALAFDRQNYGLFRDLDRLTLFADNLVPHVLRLDGILVYDPGLLARIEASEAIPLGSRAEIEIRACALQAVELVGAELRRAGHPVTSMALDHLLWNRGQGSHYKARPRHRTRCVYY